MTVETRTIARGLAHNAALTIRRVDRFDLAVIVTMRGITPTGRASRYFCSATAYGTDRDDCLARAYAALRPPFMPRGYTWGEIEITEAR